MLKYMTWEFQDFDMVEEVYEIFTGESLQLDPMINEETTHMMVGSSMLDEQAYDEIVLFAPTALLHDEWPEWFVKQEEDEE